MENLDEARKCFKTAAVFFIITLLITGICAVSFVNTVYKDAWDMLGYMFVGIVEISFFAGITILSVAFGVSSLKYASEDVDLFATENRLFLRPR